MSLYLYDPFRIQRRYDPGEGMIDHFYDDVNRLHVRDHPARLSVQPNGDFNYTVNVSGFRPEELKVDLEGDDLVVKGDHQEVHGDESVHRTFARRVKLPSGSCKETIKCDIDEHGRLAIVGKKAPIPESHRRSLPINSKPVHHAIENKK